LELFLVGSILFFNWANLLSMNLNKVLNKNYDIKVSVHDTFTGIKIRHAENQKIKKPNKFEKNL
jgi:hypothetical protein